MIMLSICYYFVTKFSPDPVNLITESQHESELEGLEPCSCGSNTLALCTPLLNPAYYGRSAWQRSLCIRLSPLCHPHHHTHPLVAYQERPHGCVHNIYALATWQVWVLPLHFKYVCSSAIALAVHCNNFHLII